MENTATVSGTEVKKYRRAGFMDEVRGFCILCMVVYHVCFDLNYTYNIHIPIMFDGWFDIVRDIFAGAFMFISGMSSRYSHNNAKRGIQCFFIGMIITFIFAFFAPSAPILFGILHFMGVSMMIYAIGDKYFLKIPAPFGIAVCAVLFLLTRGIMYGYLGPAQGVGIKLPEFIYNAGLLFPLGFSQWIIFRSCRGFSCFWQALTRENMLSRIKCRRSSIKPIANRLRLQADIPCGYTFCTSL